MWHTGIKYSYTFRYKTSLRTLKRAYESSIIVIDYICIPEVYLLPEKAKEGEKVYGKMIGASVASLLPTRSFIRKSVRRKAPRGVSYDRTVSIFRKEEKPDDYNIYEMAVDHIKWFTIRKICSGREGIIEMQISGSMTRGLPFVLSAWQRPCS